MHKCTRRDFFKKTGLLAGGAAVSATGFVQSATEAAPDLVVASGDDPAAMVRKAVAELGGMKKFVSRGDVVVIKPNMAWVRRPDQGSNTNPDVVAALVEMAFDAGAKTVKVFDRGAAETKDYRQAYAMSGIADAAKKAGAVIPLTYDMKAADLPLENGVYLKKPSVYRDALECDCFINVPVAKVHVITRLTLCMKNHMGLIESSRSEWHRQLDRAIVDFASEFKPTLNVLDAYRIMVRHGPSGGNVQDVQMARKCIVGVNQASVDAYGATLFDKKPSEIGHIALAGKTGLGEIDLSKLTIKETAI